MVYQKGQSWDLYSSVSILIIYLCIRSAECHMLADDTTLHTTGKSIVQIQKTLQLCLDRISVWCNTNHMLINPVKVCDNYYTTKAPALRLVIEAVIRWSEYWKCIWTSPTRSHCWQQISMASPDWTHENMSKKLFLLSQLQSIINHFAATPQSDVVRICAHDFQRHGDAFGTTENACFRAFITLRSQFRLHHCSQRTLTEIVSKIIPNLGLVL